MQKVTVKKNPLGLKIYVNGTPDVKEIPNDQKDLVLSALHLEIMEQFKKKRVKKEFDW